MIEVKRHEWWRHEYRKARDLDHLTAEQLSERMFDCTNNIRVHDERGRLGLMPMDKGGEPWMVWYTEVLEECVLRNYDYPGPINVSGFHHALDHAFEPVPNIQAVIEKYGLNGEKAYLLKFGDPQWLRQSLARGSFRISPASFYDESSLNHARRDTELRREITPSPRMAHVQEFMKRRGIVAPPGKIPARIAIESPTDYYLWSFSAAYSRRLWGDFAGKHERNRHPSSRQFPLPTPHAE